MSVNLENLSKSREIENNGQYKRGKQNGQFGKGRRGRWNRKFSWERRKERERKAEKESRAFKKFSDGDVNLNSRPGDRSHCSEYSTDNIIPPLMGFTDFVQPNNRDTNSIDSRKEHQSFNINLELSTDPVGKRVGNVDNSDLAKCKQEKTDSNVTKHTLEAKNKRQNDSDSRAIRETTHISTTRSISKKSSSSSSSGSDCDGDMKDLKKAVFERFLKKGSSDKSKNENAEIKKGEAETSSASSDSSSESDNMASGKPLKKEELSEDEVVCLGNLETIENLVDDEQSGSNLETCLFCKEKGHTSFHCFMVCKNCGGKYHGFKNCPKPANLSIALHNFMEFCVTQFYQYDPDRRFTLNQGEQNSDRKNIQTEFHNDLMKDVRRKHKPVSSTRSTPESSKQSRKKFKGSDSDSSYSSQRKKRHRSRKQESTFPATSTPFPSLPFNPQFSPVFPFPFSPQGIQFNPQGVAMNPLLTYAQMMGYNALK